MGALDEVSAAIGELKGLMVALNQQVARVDHKLEQTADEVTLIRSTQAEIAANGCTRGKDYVKRLDAVSSEVRQLRASKLTGKDIIKLLGGATGVSAAVAAFVELVKTFGGKS